MLRQAGRRLATAGQAAVSGACSSLQQEAACSSSAQHLDPSTWKSIASRAGFWSTGSRAYSTQEAKSMLGSTGSGMGAAHNMLEQAAEARMQKIKARGAEGFQQHGSGEAGLASRIFGAIGSAIKLSLAGTALFAGYYTYAYRDVGELEDSLKKSRPGGDSKPSGSGGDAAAPSGGLPEPIAGLWASALERYIAVRKAVEQQVKQYTDPTYHKLLPDMAPELRGRIKTLVLDLDDLLVHKEWTRQTGWQIFKRPGVQDFLLEMGGYYELVIFTDEPPTYADPIINKLDPHRVILYRLYRPETQYHNGKHVRDLSKLNRDLSQVLMISAKPEAWEFQPENTLKLKAWEKDAQDTTLLDLIPMLQLIATRGVKDVRDVVKSYDGETDIPKAFKNRMAQMAGHQKQQPKRLLGTLAK